MLSYIHIKTCQNIFVFLQQNPQFSYPGLFWEMQVLLLLVYLGIAIWRNWRAYNEHFKWKHHLSWTVISYQVLTHNRMRAKWSWIAHLSFFKLLIYRYLLEIGHAPGDPPGGAIFDHKVTVWTNLNMVHWVMLHTTYLDPVVSDRRVFFMISLCWSM